MKNTYVLDTSALVYDPVCYRQFSGHNVVIPIVVLSELDKLKKGSSEVSKNARVAIRLLDEISSRGDVSTGILLDEDVLLKIDANHIDLSVYPYDSFGDPTYGDTQILACLYANWLQNNDTILISNDINLRVKAKARGIEAEAREGDRYSLSDLYSGIQRIEHEEAGLDLQRHGNIDPRMYDLKLCPHECVLFKDSYGNGIAMGRQISHDRVKVVKKFCPWGISSRNLEQAFAIDLVMDTRVDLVTLIGRAGTGKSLVVLAAALELVLNRKEYDKLIIYRPVQPVGKDIGYLPGTLEEKLAPWFQAIMDNFELLFATKNGSDWRRELEMYIKKGRIEMDAITYVRGRSIPNSLILIDESQNLSKEEIKTILTRAGENTKVVLTGDIEQIDNVDLDATSNGLTHVIEKFKHSELAGHITFVRGERSRLASLAADIL